MVKDNGLPTKRYDDVALKAGRKAYTNYGHLDRKQMAKEESEQIDELQKKTLSNYIRGASADAANYAYTAGMRDFGKGINKDEYHDKATKRLKGISKAAQKLAKEEVEGLDEISQKLATKTFVKRAKQGDDTDGYDDPYMQSPGAIATIKAAKTRERITKKFGNAASNDAAKAYLNKEEAEGLEEKAGYSAKAGAAGKDLGKPGKNFAKIARGAAAKYGSEAAGERVAGAVLKKLRKEDRLIDLLDTVTESQAFTMVTVFNSLSEENQNMFLASCETEEGVEKMLDFSIQNRGAE
jgi:hypothetical protein